MKRVLITGAGGAPATNFVRSLRHAPEEFHLIGIDSSKYYLQRAETDERHLMPRASEDEYIPLLKELIEATGAELIFAQPDVEIVHISEHRDELGILTFLPAHDTVVICQDKYASFERWKQAGITAPETMMIHTPDDLEVAFRALGPQIWVRRIRGAAGAGSLPTEDLQEAKAWIDFNKGWGDFTAAEYLSPQSVTWQSIWKDGELVVAQGRLRLYWEFADRAPSGITGLTGAGVTISDAQIDELSERVVRAIDPLPDGIFSVDLTYDRDGMPNPTEINIGRFFTTHFFFTAAGINMPYIFVKLAYGEEPPHIPRRVNPLTPGMLWIRGMDVEPVLTTTKAVDAFEKDLEERKARLRM